MTLNFSSYPIFPSPNPAADGYDFFSSIWDRGTEGYGIGRHYSHWKETDPSYEYARDAGGGWVDNAKSCHPSNGGAGGGYTDIADLLPSDPFGMELGSTLTAAIAGWIGGHLGVDQPGADFFGAANCSNGLFSGFGSLYTGAGWMQPRPIFPPKSQVDCFPEKVQHSPVCQKPVMDNASTSVSAAATCKIDADLSVGWAEVGWIRNLQSATECSTSEGNVSQSAHFLPSSEARLEVIQPANGNFAAAHVDVDVDLEGGNITGCSGGEACPEVDGGLILPETAQPAQSPHDGLLLALGQLGIKDLLSVERVCRTLCSAVRDDPLLWRCIQISQPLNDRLTDEALLSLTKRAAGNLQCLSLVDCSRITDEGLKRVLEANPRLTKLSVPGCRLSVDILIDSLKILKARGMPGIKHLRINGLYGVTQAHYEDLKALLGVDLHEHAKPRRPQFYHSDPPISCCDYDLPLDIELCPVCQNLRIVYDCPAESCQGNNSKPCRGCRICIARCLNCGKCINDSEYEETFYLDYLCSDCVKLLIATEDPQQKGYGYYDLIPVLPSGANYADAVVTE